MGVLIRLIELLIVIVPLAGVIFAGIKAFSKVRERRDDAAVDGSPQRMRDYDARRRIERERTLREELEG